VVGQHAARLGRDQTLEIEAERAALLLARARAREQRIAALTHRACADRTRRKTDDETRGEPCRDETMQTRDHARTSPEEKTNVECRVDFDQAREIGTWSTPRAGASGRLRAGSSGGSGRSAAGSAASACGAAGWESPTPISVARCCAQPHGQGARISSPWGAESLGPIEAKARKQAEPS